MGFGWIEQNMPPNPIPFLASPLKGEGLYIQRNTNRNLGAWIRLGDGQRRLPIVEHSNPLTQIRQSDAFA